MFSQTCPDCGGQGSVVKTPCDVCRGAGAVEKSRKVVVSFPAGIDGGQRLRVPGQGMPGETGGPSGDLYVDVDLEPHEKFERDGVDLVTRGVVEFVGAALGTPLVIILPDDAEVSLDVPRGTQPGDVLIVKGKGLPRIDGRGRGALKVVVQVEVPKVLSPRAEEILAELRAELAAERSAKTA